MLFYTYLWLRKDGIPYYVGKGSGQRAWRKGSPHRDRVLVQEFPSEADAFLAERFLIALYGREDLSEGCLINLTDGGDGLSGHKHTEDSRRKMSQAVLGRRLSQKHCENISVAKKKWATSDEGRIHLLGASKRAVLGRDMVALGKKSTIGRDMSALAAYAAKIRWGKKKIHAVSN